ncbi:MAG: NAD(P)-dependent oxidoreductase, partial [Myxococcota bacterium]
MDLESLLRDTAPFSALDAGAVGGLAVKAARRDVPSPGDVVFREGAPGEYVFLVAEGSFDVFKRAPGDASEVRLRTLAVGEVGGLTSMATEATRAATLRAGDDGGVLVTWARRDISSLVDAHPAFARAVIRHLGEKVRQKTHRLAALRSVADDEGRTRVAFFDTKPYDRRSFEAARPETLTFDYLEPRLDAATAALADGASIVCAFVNDVLDARVLARLAHDGVRLVALRCAGYNHVDVAAAERVGLTVTRVPAYSPHAVAEHGVALMLALNRNVHRAHQRVREGNFTLDGLVGFDLHGRTAGLVGLGKIGARLARIL